MSTISREELEGFWYPLSYFFGAWLGDGHYMWNPYSHTYQIGFVSMDRELVEKVWGDLNSHFADLRACGYDEDSESGTRLFRLRYNNKTFTDFICRATAYKTMLPEFVWSAPKNVQLEMLKGLMDTDGTIVKQKYGKNRSDGFCYLLKFSGTKGFVEQFPDLCRVIGIAITSSQVEYHANPNHSDRKVFNLSLPSAVNNRFSFYCLRKQARLEEYLSRKHSTYDRTMYQG